MTKNEFCEMVLQSFGPAEKLIGMVPADKLNWKPGPTFMSTGQVLAHLSDGLGGGLETTLSGKWPSMEEMDAGMKLENMPSCGVQEALSKLAKDKATLRSILDGISEDDFTSRMVSVPWGWTAKFEIMSMGFLGHFNNHKMQLFTYLKLLGLPVNTETLYGA
ncbi:MAG: DinB family protein [Terriglobia bacterium]